MNMHTDEFFQEMDHGVLTAPKTKTPESATNVDIPSFWQNFRVLHQRARAVVWREPIYGMVDVRRCSMWSGKSAMGFLKKDQTTYAQFSVVNKISMRLCFLCQDWSCLKSRTI